MKQMLNAQTISEYLMTDYIEDMELNNGNRLKDEIQILLDNNLAYKIAGSDDIIYASVSLYKVACKFLTKYNKAFKECRRKLLEYEFGGEQNTFAKTDKRLVKLSKYSLEAGSYYVELDKGQYAVLNIEFDDEDEYIVKYELYFIGDKCKKWKSKFYKMVDKYEAIRKMEKNERILYTDDRPVTKTIFKPFDKVIFKNKDNVLKYIDNWVESIPEYYAYGMTPKLSIILYGDPGTGKSTFCKALANYLDISSVTSIGPEYFTNDNNTNQYAGRRRSSVGISSVSTVYALDDVDCVCKSREIKDDAENAKVLANLLSFLDNPPTFDYKAKDGVRYPVSIVVATTNYYDKLDDAVKRYGRFDLKIEMKNFEKEEAEAMCAIYDLKLEDLVKDSNKKGFAISPSYLQALCLENLDKSMKNRALKEEVMEDESK